MSGSPEKLSAAGQAKLHADHVRWYRQIVNDRKPLTWQEGRDLLNAIDALQAENERLRKVRDAALPATRAYGVARTKAIIALRHALSESSR